MGLVYGLIGGNHSPLSDFDGDERLESSINILQINHSSVSKYVFLQLESSVINYFEIWYDMVVGKLWLRIVSSFFH